MTSDPGAAADLLAELLAIRRRVLGDRHPDTITTLGNHAAALWWAKRYADAAPAFHEYVILCDQIRPANHPSCAERRKGEGKALRELGRYPEAEQALLDAYARKTKAEGAQFGGPAEVARELAELYRRWDKPAQMQEWLARAGDPAPPTPPR
jgi:tetratricopeptide (TPR) repeat protein